MWQKKHFLIFITVLYNEKIEKVITDDRSDTCDFLRHTKSVPLFKNSNLYCQRTKAEPKHSALRFLYFQQQCFTFTV